MDIILNPHMPDSRPWVTKFEQFWGESFPKQTIEEDNPLLAWTLDPTYPMAGMCFYLLSKPILKQICKRFGFNGKSQAMKYFVTVHSALLSIYSAWTVFFAYKAVFKTYAEYGWMTVYCNTDNRLWNNGLGVVSILFYISKMYEYVDTWILIIKGKKVSVLQGFHHAIAVPCMWAQAITQSPGIVPFVCFNGLIHTFMYCYYAFAAMGYRSSLKRYLTTGQLVQFVSGISMCMPYYYLGDHCTTPGQRWANGFVQVVAAVLIILFANFFVQTYLKKHDEKTERKNK